MSDRFDLEQKLFSCWSVCEDLDILAKNPELSDELREVVQSMKTVYQFRFNDCFNLFEEMTVNRKIV